MSSTYDWLLVKIRGFQKEKGYIYGTRYDNGQNITICQKNARGRKFVDSMSNTEANTYTPPGSVVALYSVEKPRDDREFYIAGWATPVSKDLKQDDVYVTPIKISERPLKIKPDRNGKEIAAVANVLDAEPFAINSIEEFRHKCLEASKKESPQAFDIGSSRGFMVRIGTIDGDERITSASFEFIGRPGNSPEQTWGFHWNLTPSRGRQKNLLKTVVDHAASNLSRANGFVEVVGLSRALINDYGREDTVKTLTSLPNYKCEHAGKLKQAYSLAAVVVSKQDTKRVIKAQQPLPRKKVIADINGMLGRHAGSNFPTVIPHNIEASIEQSKAAPDRDTVYPLSITDHVTKDGEIRSFIVKGNDTDVTSFQDRIERAGRGVIPYKSNDLNAYIFPQERRQIVSTALFDLAGTFPFYYGRIEENGKRYIAIEGEVENPLFKNSIESIEKRLGAINSNGKPAIPEGRLTELVTSLKRIESDYRLSKHTKPLQDAPTPQNISTTESAKPETPPEQKAPKVPKRKKGVSFGAWQLARFNRDPFLMMEFLSSEIAQVAAAAGIDWDQTAPNIYFGNGSRKDIIKGRSVIPLNNSHRGSVAVAAKSTEKHGDNGDSIVNFTIRFWNKKLLIDDTITFSSYEHLKNEYERDMESGIVIEQDNSDLERIKQQSEARERIARNNAAKAAEEAAQSVNYWAAYIPTLKSADGSHPYWKEKGIGYLVDTIDLRTGVDPKKGKYDIIALHDINDNFVGCQRFFEKPFVSDNGKTSNKDFIFGTAFVNENDQQLGTHIRLGEIRPDSEIHYCEGLATGASIHAATQQPVIVLLNSGNLKSSIPLFVDKYPNQTHICAYDNDSYKPRVGNTGYRAALEVSAETGIDIVGPDFSNVDTANKPTDFNDLHLSTGLVTVKQQLSNRSKAPVDPLDYARLYIQLVGTDNLNNVFIETCQKLSDGVLKNRSEESIAGALYKELVSVHGLPRVLEIIDSEYVSGLGLEPSTQSDPLADNDSISDFPISIRKYTSKKGTKGILIKDSSNRLNNVVEDAISSITGGRENSFIYSKSLGGWFVPGYKYQRILGSYLHEYCDMPQLYIGTILNTSNANNGVPRKVIRGDFSDKSYQEFIVSSIRFANPVYREDEYGVTFEDGPGVEESIRERLRGHLRSQPYNAKEVSGHAPQVNTDGIDDQEYKKKLREAVSLAGIDERQFVTANIDFYRDALRTAFSKDDIYIQALLVSANNSFSHLETSAKTQQTIEAALRSARAIVDGESSIQPSNDALDSLKTFVYHHDISNEKASDELFEISEHIIEAISENRTLRHTLSIDDVEDIISGSNTQFDTTFSNEILNLYRSLLLEDINELNKRDLDIGTPDNLEAPTESGNGLKDGSQHPDETGILSGSEQSDRIQELLLIVRSSIEKGFEYEEFYDQFLTQPGSPYYDTDSNSFNEPLFNIDLKHMSDPETHIQGWDNTKVMSATGLFAHEHTRIGESRIAELEQYITSFIEQRGALGFRSFAKSLPQEDAVEGSNNPYLIDGDFDAELLNSDLAYFTEFQSINALYREIVESITSPETSVEEEVDNTSVNESFSSTREIDQSNSYGTATLNKFSINSSTLYEVVLTKTGVDDTRVPVWIDYSEHREGLEAQVSHWMSINNSGEKIDSLPPRAMKGEFDRVLVDYFYNDGARFEFVEIANDSKEYYVVSSSSDADEPNNKVLSISTSFMDGFEYFKSLDPTRQTRVSDTISDDRREDAHIPSTPKGESVSDKLSNLFTSMASNGANWEAVRSEVRKRFNLELSDSQDASIKSKFESLVSSLDDSKDISSRFENFYSFVYTIAQDELEFDDFLEDYFKTDGLLAETNPYFNAELGTIDKVTALNDIQGAGYKSLAHFYDSIFRHIHNRSVNDHVIHRVGGYIKSDLPVGAPVRPELLELSNIFNRLAIYETAPSFIPLFNDWAQSSNSQALSHPIFSENLSEIESSDLTNLYQQDELLMLADVHGCNVSISDDSDSIASTILKNWEVRSSISRLGPSGLRDMELDDLRTIASSIDQSASGSKDDVIRRLITHTELMSTHSRTRISQYSYIQQALAMESKVGYIPNYAINAISTFVENESNYFKATDIALKDARNADLRKKIDRVLTLTGGAKTAVRSTLINSDFSKGLIVGIDTRKKLALTFSDKQLEHNAKLARYKNIYAVPDGINVADVQLPKEITHYAVFENGLIGTAIAVDNDHLISSGLVPISDTAVEKSSNYINEWVAINDYVYYKDSSGERLFATTNPGSSSWQLYKINNDKIEEVKGFRSQADLCKHISKDINSFLDRDILIEDYIALCNSELKHQIGVLDKISSLDVDSSFGDRIDKLLSSTEFSSLIPDEAVDERQEVRLKLAGSYISKLIRDEAWQSITGSGIQNTISSLSQLLSPGSELNVLVSDIEQHSFGRQIGSSQAQETEHPPLESATVESGSEYNSSSIYSVSQPEHQDSITNSTQNTFTQSPEHTKHEYIEITGNEYIDTSSGVRINETESRNSSEAIFIYPDGEYRSKAYDDVISVEAEESAKKLIAASSENDTDGKKASIEEIVIGQTIDMFGNFPEPEDEDEDEDVITDFPESGSEFENKLVGYIDSNTGQPYVGVFMTADNGPVLQLETTALSSTEVSFDEFIKTDHAYAPAAEHMSHDPRSSKGMEAISKLSSRKLNDIAKVLGLPVSNVKAETVSRIRATGQAINAIQILSNQDDIFHPDYESHLRIVENVVDPSISETGDLTSSQQWLDSFTEGTKQRLALFNYKVLHGLKEERKSTNQTISVDIDGPFVYLSDNHLKIDNVKSFGSLKELLDAFSDLEHHNHPEAIAATYQLGLDAKDIEYATAKLSELSDRNNNIEITIQGGSVLFRTDYDSYSTIESAIEGLINTKPLFSEGDPVSALIDNEVVVAEVAETVYLADSIPVRYKVDSVLDVDETVDRSNLLSPEDEIQLEEDFYTSINGIECDVNDLVERIKASTTPLAENKPNIYSAVIQNLVQHQEYRVSDILNHLPEGYICTWQSGLYSIVNTNNGSAIDGDFDTVLDSLISNTLNNEVIYDEHSTESLGDFAQVPHGELSSTTNSPIEEEQRNGEILNTNAGGNAGAIQQDSDSGPGEPGSGQLLAETGPGETSAITDIGDSIPGIPSTARGGLFKLDASHNIDFSESKSSERIEWSIQALELRKEILDSNRIVTDSDKDILSRYSGFSGATGIFNASNYEAIVNRNRLRKCVSEKEYASIRSSVNTAFYTPQSVIEGVWEAARHLGFKKGNILDPCTGTGHFIGAAPDDIASNSRFIAKEKEEVSSNIASLIYGNNIVKNEAFEATRLPGNYFDLAISNIPFGNLSVHDPEYNRHKLLIHDYFILKSLDKVKPGGIVALITSTGTLDKANSAARELMLERGDLVGAIRLPNNTFLSSAGTSAAGDLLLFRKREPELGPLYDTAWVTKSSKSRSFDDDEWESEHNNLYFAKNPNMIIGEIKEINGRFGPELAYIHDGSSSLKEEILSRIEGLPKNIIKSRAQVSPEPEASVYTTELSSDLNTNLRHGCYVYNQGSFGVLSERWDEQKGVYTPVIESVEIPKTRHEVLRDYIRLRDIARDTIAIQMGEFHDDELKSLQSKLNSEYDNFVSNHGHIQSKEVSKIISIDPDYPIVSSLEQPRNDQGKIVKSDIFYHQVLNDTVELSATNDINEALYASMRKFNHIDVAYIESITNRSWSDLEPDLSGKVFLDPETSKFQLAERYLSGNIRDKIETAKEAVLLDSRFSANITALESVLPDPIPAYDIKARLGSPWIPSTDIAKFMAHILEGSEEQFSESNYNCAHGMGIWKVDVSGTPLFKGKDNNESEWGTSRVPFVSLMDKILNSRQIKVMDSLGDGTRVLNKDETLAANEKAEAIKEEFKQWIWSNPDRATKLAQIYNDKVNVFVEPKYSPKSVSFPGIASSLDGKPLKPYDSQYAAVARYLSEGRCLFAHPVGAGKTLELVASAVVGKQKGVHSKALIVVPNNVLSQFGNMAKSLFPNCKALIATKKELEKGKRQTFTARAATSNWDMIVISMSMFDKIRTPIESQRQVIQEERSKLRDCLSGLSNNDNRATTLTVKAIERKLDKLETDIEKLADAKVPDDHLDLASMGVDALFVDEADNFLNLSTPTQMANIAGVNNSASQQAMDMLMAVRYIQNLNGNYRGIIFGTGTDIRNSMSDMYTMQRYLSPDLLENAGLGSFDEYMGTFGEVVTAIELNPEGTGYRQNSRLSRFVNVPEMAILYRQIADVIVPEQLNLPRPEVEQINVVAEPCDWLKMYMADLANRAQNTRNGRVDPSEDNILKISHNGKQASLDIRLIDPSIPAPPDGKISKCADNIAKEYEAGADKKLVQVVFCDQGTPGGSSSINIYQILKDELIKRGVKEDEIVFAHDFNTDKRKDLLRDRLNDGTYRVAIGSTDKIGVGNNFQRLLVAQHDLDPPWRPRDLEQRGGRMERTGNTNQYTRRYNYSTQDSFDLFMWETLKRKANFIYQTKVSPRDAARVLDEDVTPNYSEIMAITTGNPLIKRKIEITSQIERLEAGERVFNRAKWSNANRISELTNRISSLTNRLDSISSILPHTEAGTFMIGKSEVTDHKEGGKLLKAVINEFNKRGLYNSTEPLQIGQIGQIPITLRYIHSRGRWAATIEDDQRRFTLSDKKVPSMMVEDIMRANAALTDERSSINTKLSEYSDELNSLRNSSNGVYPAAEELKALKIEATEVEVEIAKFAESEQESKRDIGDFSTELQKLKKGQSPSPGM